jgi:hypothetical protein
MLAEKINLTWQEDSSANSWGSEGLEADDPIEVVS